MQRRKQNNSKTPQYVIVALAIIAVTMTYQYFKNIQLEQRKKHSLSSTHKSKDRTPAIPPTKTHKNKHITRKIASLKQQSSVIKKFQDRKIVGTFIPQKDFPISNKINKNWKKLALKKLNRYKPSNTKIEITPVKSAIFVKHNIGRYVEHVKIVLTKKSGLVSAYDAYVDSQSGSVIRTWNRTKIEFKPRTSVPSLGNEFYAHPLQKDSSRASL